MKTITSAFRSALIVIFMAFSFVLQAQFAINGEFRGRGEYRDGYGTIRDSSKTPYFPILGRARLQFDYSYEKITTRFSIQDAWVFGQDNYGSDTITKNTVNIYEAWMRYSFTKSISAKAGRMELVYDDERLLGNSNWSMQAASHDAVLLQWEIPGLNYRGDFGFALNNIAPAGTYLNSYTLRNNYKYMAYLYEKKQFLNNKIDLSLLALLDAFQKPSTSVTSKKTTYDTLYVHDPNDSIIGSVIIPTVTNTTTTKAYPGLYYARFTVGANATFTIKNWNFFLSGYYQGGHYKDGRKLSSNFYIGTVSYRFCKPFRLLLGYEHMSGNNYSDTTGFKEKATGFSSLYGTGHRFYGYMDLFSSQIRDNLGPGLNQVFARGTITLNETMNIEATWRWFSLPNGYLPVDKPKSGELPYVSVKKSLGHEIDLMYVWKPLKNLEVNAAYCFMLPTETMEIQRGLKPGTSKFANYAYLMITYKPKLFTTAKE